MSIIQQYNIKTTPKKGHGYIYECISPNNKRYIGQSRQSIEKELGSNGNNSKKNYLLFEGFLKYGFNNFKIRILGIYPISLLQYFQNYFIQQYNTIFPYGYNIGSDIKTIKKDVLNKVKYYFKSQEVEIILDSRNNVSKPVVQLTKDEKVVAYYSSIALAEESTNIRHIGEVCNGHRKTAGGFYWRFIKEEDIIND